MTTGTATAAQHRPAVPAGRPPLEFLGPRHPLRGFVDGLLAGLADRATDLGGGPAADPAADVEPVTELRGARVAGRWQPQRFYCSLQARDRSTGRFDAWTVNWSAGGPVTWQRLPEDPKLPALAGVPIGEVEVLRYVPLRRFTYRQDGLVTKVKRRSRLQDSWTRALAVERAVQRAAGRAVAGGSGRGPAFAVPALVAVDPEAATYTQADVPGRELAALAAGPRLEPLLAEAGAVHAAFHTLDAPDLPEGGTADVWTGPARDAGWAAFLLPQLAGPISRAVARLTMTGPEPVDPSDVVTCHGDLVPSHLLGRPGAWTVIDHDLAHRGDRYRDLALFIAGLSFDLPALAPGRGPVPTLGSAPVEAYLAGYEEVLGRPLDRHRLARHLLAAHLHHAALLATKDRAREEAVTTTAALLADAVAAVRCGDPR